ncbi:MAG: methyl-accepting chemotaxis protein [Opitutales bacterium]
MRIGRRIALGYAVVIGVTSIVGLASVLSSQNARKEVEKLDSVFLPEMQRGSEVERSAAALFLHSGEYGNTFARSELAIAREEFARVRKLVEEAREVALEDDQEQFGELAGETRRQLENYGQLLDQSEEAINQMVAQGDPLNAASAAFVRFCEAFVNDQIEALNTQVAQSQAAIALAQEISDRGTQARILSFEAQSSNNYGLFEDATAELEIVLANADKLAAQTEELAAQQSIASIRSSASGYNAAIVAYYAQVSDEEDMDVMAMMESRNLMEESAGLFSASIKSFLESQNEALNKAITGNLAQVEAASAVLAQGNAINADNFSSQAARDKDGLQGAINDFDAVFAAVDGLRQMVDEDTELASLAAIEGAARDYQGAMSSYLAAWTKLDTLKLARDRSAETVLDNANAMAASGRSSAEGASQANASHLSFASTVAIVGTLFSVVTAIVLAIFSVRSITAAIRGLVKKLNATSGSVYTASRQVSGASHELAQGSSEQAASVEETSSSLEELASMTRQNAEHAATANRTVQSTAEVVQEATGAMNELTASMAQIADGSKETQKIIKTIDEIAFQTNLLALNAAVEAARAGEAGAGFAVVADEVRNLAIRAAEAARNTAGLIENSVQKIDVGSSLLGRTNEAFSRVAAQTNEVRDLISNIATASGEQSNGIEQINKAVSEMDRVVQTNASSAEETASAANELNDGAKDLERVVSELNALVDGASSRGASEAPATGRGSHPPADDNFDFDLPKDFEQHPKSAPKRAGSVSKASGGGSTSGVIRDSEMNHDDFSFDDSDFNFESDDSDFESPQR